MQNVDDIRSNVREIITVSPSSLSLMHTFIFICLFSWLQSASSALSLCLQLQSTKY